MIRIKFINFAKKTNSVLKITQDPIGLNLIYRCESPYIELDGNVIKMLSELHKLVDIMEISAENKDLFVIEATYRIAETRILPI